MQATASSTDFPDDTQLLLGHPGGTRLGPRSPWHLYGMWHAPSRAAIKAQLVERTRSATHAAPFDTRCHDNDDVRRPASGSRDWLKCHRCCCCCCCCCCGGECSTVAACRCRPCIASGYMDRISAGRVSPLSDQAGDTHDQPSTLWNIRCGQKDLYKTDLTNYLRHAPTKH